MQLAMKTFAVDEKSVSGYIVSSHERPSNVSANVPTPLVPQTPWPRLGATGITDHYAKAVSALPLS